MPPHSGRVRRSQRPGREGTGTGEHFANGSGRSRCALEFYSAILTLNADTDMHTLTEEPISALQYHLAEG